MWVWLGGWEHGGGACVGREGISWARHGGLYGVSLGWGGAVWAGRWNDSGGFMESRVVVLV